MIHDPPLLPPFIERFASLPEVQFSGPRSSFHGCFGCGPEHEIGLRVRTFSAGDEVLAPIVVPRRFEGPPGAAHGGIVAAYLDEVLAGAAVNHSGKLYVTGELSVRYVKGTPIERPLLGRGRAVRDRQAWSPAQFAALVAQSCALADCYTPEQRRQAQDIDQRASLGHRQAIVRITIHR